MKKIMFILLIVLLTGCTSLYQGRAIKTADGVRFKMSKPGSMSYKDETIEASFDTKTPSILRGIIEAGAMGILSGRK